MRPLLTRLRWAALALVPLAILLAVAAAFLFMRQGGLEPLRVPDGGATAIAAEPALVERGAYLARLGNCLTCHTTRGGTPYAGGRGFATPWGTLYSSNLTPDAATGLGDWSLDQFRHAMRHGVTEEAGFLYPAFPFANFALLTDPDLEALYAFLRTQAPVRAPQRPDTLAFPAGSRGAILAWRMLFHRPRAPFEPRPDRSAAWNRGRYLVDGVGHCDMCHGERGAFGSLPADRYMAGGRIPGEGWYAPPLGRQALARYGVDELAQFLRTGVSPHGAAYGPMAEVVYSSLRALTPEDAQAMAVYLKDIPDRPRTAYAGIVGGTRAGELAADGRRLYARHCAECHGADGRGRGLDYPPLAGNPSLAEGHPVNTVRMVLYGGVPPVTAGNPRPYSMPPFAHQLSDAEVAAVVTYVRQAWGNRGGAVSPDQIEDLRGLPLQ
ncbi:c-type cytochrome [Coralloluteibacterium stylophorae]|uniref:C-type cytochrome n=1 Tax=Coralloluteibacterium stylophorae TaxID=1776034 RepID=A0A8J7VQU6_9GAMM|nr:cytochrome c [Coralloluteibacterium stylophorae]MBS7455523.1 c-type cytochrome [Coralloluteibacterium stylophorae]